MKRATYLAGFILLLACQNDRPAQPDISEGQIHLPLVRYEQLLFDSEIETSQITEIIKKHPLFSEIFFRQVLKPATGETLQTTAQRFVTDTLSRQLYEEVRNRYGDFSREKTQLEKALALYGQYLPDEPLPEVFTCISNFEVGSFTVGPEVMGIGLDFFLGPNYPYDPRLFPDYISHTMTREHLVAKSMQALIEQRIPPNGGIRFIDQMIRNGMVLYLKEKVLPDLDPSIVHEFSPEQLDWVKDNESEIWAFIISENLLYENNERKFRKMVSPSPNVPGMPEEAPGRVGNWVGYRIVKAYCERTDAQPAELLDVQDVQIIMAGSKYKPRR